MNKISQLGILLVCLFMALPLKAQTVSADEIQEAIEKFFKNRNVKITNGSYDLSIDEFTDLPKDSVMDAQFFCKGEKPLERLVKAFEDGEEYADLYRSYLRKGNGMTHALKATIGPKGMGENCYCVLDNFQHTRVIVYGFADGTQEGFVLSWDDLPKGEKKGFVIRYLGYDMEIVKLEQGDDQITMDSVRTAIKIGEVVKRELNGGAGDAQKEIDTTYIDGKWAVSSEYHRKVMKALDRISEMGLNSTDLYKTVATLAEFSNTASSTELASIGFALKREAKRYNGLISPELFSMIWNELYKMQSIVKRVNPQIEDYFTASEIILRGKINESVRLLFHDERRQQYLRDRGFTVTKNEGGRWYYAVWGKHYTGNKEIPYLDGCADEDGVLKYTAEHVEANLKPGIYRLTAAGRTSYKGNTGAFIFAYTKENEKTPLLREIPANDDRYGDIWQQAAIRIREADEKGLQISPKDVRITLANGGIGYGWSKIVIDNIVVRDGTLTYGVSCDEDFTGIHFSGRWLSATDFVLERIGDLPKE